MSSIASSALRDIRAAIRLRPVWLALASEDVSDQHRRTTLGPVWLLVNYLAFAGTFMLILGDRFEVPDFSAHIAIGLFVWLHISEVVSQSVTLFVREEAFIKGTTLPLSGYILRMTLQSMIRAAYTLLGCVALVLILGAPLSYGWAWAAGGLILIALTTPAVIGIFATAGAFFPDLQYVVSNVMRLGLFLTPIFWVPTATSGIRRALTDWNPFYYYLEIVRAPMLTGSMPFGKLAVCLTIGIVMWVTALSLLGKYRKQIVHVL
jgi:ABC-type polysaccharide/polyol phosphate export permease